MRKSARVSEKLVSPGLPGLKVATRLIDLSSVPRIPADNTILYTLVNYIMYKDLLNLIRLFLDI